ncbi:alpha/beta hydrolase [Herbivorax sp. ANBcel31]|uniref:alpha/beta hydrolase n=1 Tax=Herbivorax sp. ANBcel31 TaxID=3069754 RepID=UPI0027B59E5D|nr:alpha/beta hydrolase [Herbivorax sp. ANBcel31]MDQ2086997.1 alpha/beta hydrolase [Herbivorax sp. ANBcel31]
MKSENTVINKNKKIRKLSMSILRISTSVLIGLIIGCIALYIFQDKLIFMPQGITEETINYTNRINENVEEINYKAKDGTNLHGWFVNNIDIEKPKLLIYFGGNAEEISYMTDKVQRYEDWSVALMNYRGYGLSEGKPSEKNFYSDALEIYDYFLNRQNVKYSKIVVIGRSIGTGVATYLADKRDVNGVILISPFDSLVSVGKEQFPMFPISLIARHKFNSIERAPKIAEPLGIIIASEDQIIPPRHSRKLAKKWGGTVNIKEIDGEGHNSVSGREEYWKFIGEFLRSITIE